MDKYSEQIAMLINMGFSNSEHSAKALKLSNGELEPAIEWLCNNPEPENNSENKERDN